MLKDKNPLIILGAVFLFFLPVILSPYIWGFRDFHRYIYPLKYFARESMLSGIIPFWNPYIGSGMPYLANLQSCIFYPPSIFIYMLPLNLGLKVYVLFHFALAGISMYLLARKIGLCETSSLVASIVWTFSGWMVSSIDIIIVATSSSYLPLILFFALKSKDGFFYSILTGIALSFQFLAGEPSIFYFTLLLLLCFSFYFKLKMRRTLISILIGIGLSLFQLIPFIEMISYSERLWSQKNTTSWAFVPYELFNFILPSATGNLIKLPHLYLSLDRQMWLKSPYLGIVPFILAAVAILYPKKERAVSFFAGLSCFAILLSFGDRTPLYKLSQFLPLFSLVRYPVKWLYLATFPLSILAGFSACYILKKERVFINLILSAAYLIFLLLSLCFFTNYSFLSHSFAIKWAGNLCSDSFFILIILGFFLIATILFRKSLKEKWYKTLLLGLILTDLFWFGEELNPVIRESLYKEGNIAKFLQATENRYFRYCLSPKTNEDFYVIKGATFEKAVERIQRYAAPNFGMLFGLFDAGAYDSIYLADYFGFRKLIGMAPFQIALPLISMTNIRYIISKWPIKEEEIRLVHTEDELFLYENPNFFARAFFVENFKVIEDRKEVLKYIFSKSFDPEKEVVLEEMVSNKQEAGGRIQNTEYRIQNTESKIIRYEPNKVVIDVKTPNDGFVFLSDTYYPGWKATIDGKKTRLYRANYCFRAVKVEKGDHLIEMRFLPKSFVIGLAGSIISLIFITITFFIVNRPILYTKPTLKIK